MTKTPEKVADILDDYLRTIDEPRPADGKLHPSSLWLCDRQAVMVARGEPVTNPPDGASLRRFAIGKYIHTLLQDALLWRYGDEDFSAEFLIELRDLPIGGHGDTWIRIAISKKTKEVTVYEFKSTRSLAKVRKEPQYSHAQQGKTYAVALKAAGYNVVGLRVVYFEKSNADILEHFLPYLDSWEDEVTERIAELEPYLQPGGPLPPCTGPAWLEKYCDFYPSCREKAVSGEATVEDFVW